MIFPDHDNPPEACPVLPSEGERTQGDDGVSVSSLDGTMSIDVRGLQPPQPLIGILSVLDGPDAPDTLIVIHDRDPLLLYPELEDRGWAWETIPAPEGELHLRLTRNPRNPGSEG